MLTPGSPCEDSPWPRPQRVSCRPSPPLRVPCVSRLFPTGVKFGYLCMRPSGDDRECDEVPPMKYRQLGDSQLTVSEIAFGSWLNFSNGPQKDAAIACVHRALDR